MGQKKNNLGQGKHDNRRAFLRSSALVATLAVGAGTVAGKKSQGRDQFINTLQEKKKENDGISNVETEKKGPKKTILTYMFNNGEKLNVRWKPLGQYRAMAKIGSTSYTYELPKQMQKKFESMKKEQEVEIQKSIKKSHEKLAEKVKEDN